MTLKPCPDENVLLDFLAGSLADAQRAAVEQHLAECGTCRAAVAGVAAGMPGSEQATSPPSHLETMGQAPEAVAATLLAPGERVDHYRVDGLVGRGGMSDIYRARDTQLSRRVAIKVIRPETLAAPGALDRFLFEAKVTASFSHPHIVTVFGVGTHRGAPYLAMEYLEGKSLRQRLLEGPLGLDEALDHGAAIGEAMLEAHRRQVVHRDLKPENVLLPTDGRLRVVDFGLVRGLEAVAGGGWDATTARELTNRSLDLGLDAPPATEPGMVTGTPAYVSPERWLGEAAGPAADVWALGMILHEMLAHQRPYPELSTTALVLRVAHRDPVPLNLPASVPAEVVEVVRGCLDKDPRRRASAAAVVEVLRRARAALAVSAPPAVAPPVGPQALARARLSRGLVAVVAAAGLLGAAVAVTLSRPDLAAPGAAPAEVPAAAPGQDAVVEVPGPADIVISAPPAAAAGEPVNADDKTPGAAPAPAPAAAPPARRTTAGAGGRAPGVLSIQSYPWGRVYVDGRDTGLFTPAANLQVAPGRHTVEVRNPDTGHGKSWTVNVRPGQALRYAVDLGKGPALNRRRGGAAPGQP